MTKEMRDVLVEQLDTAKTPDEVDRKKDRLDGAKWLWGCPRHSCGVGGMNPDGSARTDGLYRNRGTGAFLYGNDLKYPIPAE